MGSDVRIFLLPWGSAVGLCLFLHVLAVVWSCGCASVVLVSLHGDRRMFRGVVVCTARCCGLRCACECDVDSGVVEGALLRW